jgi:hypothetical protein
MAWWNSQSSLHAAWILASILGLIAISALVVFEIAEARTDATKQHERHRLLVQLGLIALALLAVFEVATFVFELRREALDEGRIITASASLSLDIAEPAGGGRAWATGDRDYLAFVRSGTAVLVLRSTNESWTPAPSLGASFDLSSTAAQVVGRLQDLAEAQTLQIQISGFNKPISGGKLSVLLNNSLRLQIDVPPGSFSQDGILVVPVAQSALAPLLRSP